MTEFMWRNTSPIPCFGKTFKANDCYYLVLTVECDSSRMKVLHLLMQGGGGGTLQLLQPSECDDVT